MIAKSNKSKGFRLPILQGVLPIKAAQIPSEIIAGITLAALAIPEVMGYTKISGTPVITGLYTILVPMALFAFSAPHGTWWSAPIRRRRPFSLPAWWESRPPAPMST